MAIETIAANKTGAPALEAAYAKITWHLLPFLAVLWIIAWIDRVNIGFAKLEMLDNLKFSEVAYGFGAGIFFLGYFLFGCQAISCSLGSARAGRSPGSRSVGA